MLCSWRSWIKQYELMSQRILHFILQFCYNCHVYLCHGLPRGNLHGAY